MPHYDQIGEYGLNQLVAKRLTTPGGAVAPTVAPELFPTLTLENDRPEWGYPKGEILGGIYMSQGAVSGQYSMFQLYLPSNARSIAVVTRIRGHATANVQVGRLVGISGGLGGWSAQASTTRDFRTSGNGTSLIIERQSNAALPTRFPALGLLAVPGDVYDAPLVIVPGTSLGIYAQTVNTTPIVSVQWYERTAQPGELV